jgi:hypothetical protein
MRWPLVVFGLFGASALPSGAQDKQPPGQSPPAYFKVEVRGTVRVAKAPGSFEPRELTTQPVWASIRTPGATMGLDFGGNKELAALARTLDGKTVLVGGELRRAVGTELSGYPDLDVDQRPTAGPPLSTHPRLRFVDYIRVTTLKAAE